MFQPNEEVTVTLTATEWNEVLAQLWEGTARKVMPLITKINDQAQKHNNGAAERDLAAEERAHVSY